MDRIPVNPLLIKWAIERSRKGEAFWMKHFPKLDQWIDGTLCPTLTQLEKFAHASHVPVGYLFLPAPPEEKLPIPDFRTLEGRAVRSLSPDLLEIIYMCQQRQEWYREYAVLHGLPSMDFVGSMRLGEDPVNAAETMRGIFKLSIAERQGLASWTEALSQLVLRTEQAGVLVMRSSVVGNNTSRHLDVGEFRGFALADKMAPLVFINTSDSKSAQMFTLAHEVAHLGLGESGVFDTEAGRLPNKNIETWCNAVAAEFLLPISMLREEVREPVLATEEMLQRLAKVFKVSTLVIVRRLFDAGMIDGEAFRGCYGRELGRIRLLEAKPKSRGGGGDFYRTFGTRVGRRFAVAVLSSTFEGQTLFQDAFRMLGTKKAATLHAAARELGVMP